MPSSKINLAIDTLASLKVKLSNIPEEVTARACKINPWFSPFYIAEAGRGISQWLEEDLLHDFVQKYSLPARRIRLGLITAGNLPFVGFHDILVGLLSDCELHLQASRRDVILTQWLVDNIASLAPVLGERIHLYDRLPGDIDCLIATGSDNAARYFQHHFSELPKLIRGNRTSVAIIRESTTEEEIQALAKDVFLYNGLGCRNVSHLCLVGNVGLEKFDLWDRYPMAQLNPRYLTVFQRKKATLAWLGKPYTTVAKSILVENKHFSPPPMAVLHYRYFENEEILDSWLSDFKPKIQCIIGKEVDFGQSQSPKLYDFADGIDTMKFLRKRTLS
jgi:hypothetical protein